MFKTDETLSRADAVVAAVGQDEDIVYSKSTSLQVGILNTLSLATDPATVTPRPYDLCFQCL